MELKYGFVCDSANLTTDGRLNALGIFEAIFATQFPATHAHLALVLALELKPIDAGQHRVITVVVITDDGRETLRIEASMTLPPPPMPALVAPVFQIHDLVNITFPEAGRYEFNILIDGHPTASVPLHLVKIQQPTSLPPI